MNFENSCNRVTETTNKDKEAEDARWVNALREALSKGLQGTEASRYAERVLTSQTDGTQA
ncbi:hypothetical protein AGMMS50268_02000 [Spirochaetia bacterium]|nr:hypothetical protein AGMMS50268_02000 [Spirochaetia bacterium]